MLELQNNQFNFGLNIINNLNTTELFIPVGNATVQLFLTSPRSSLRCQHHPFVYSARFQRGLHECPRVLTGELGSNTETP